MYSKTLSLPFILPVVFTVIPVCRAELGLSALDDDTLPFLAPDEQIFDTVSPFEGFGSDTDLFAANDCSESADIFDPLWDEPLQARGNTCPDAPPQTGNSAGDDDETNNPGEGGNPPSSEKLNSDFFDNSLTTNIDPLKRIFSLPKDYQDQRCKEYEYIRFAVCSSGDYRDEAKSMAYSFFPVQAYRLRQCTFMFSEFSICFNPGKIWCCVVYTEFGGVRVADGCLEVTPLLGGQGGSLMRSPLV